MQHIIFTYGAVHLVSFVHRNISVRQISIYSKTEGNLSAKLADRGLYSFSETVITSILEATQGLEPGLTPLF